VTTFTDIAGWAHHLKTDKGDNMKKIKYDINQNVILSLPATSGQIIGQYTYRDQEPLYLVRMILNKGKYTNQWLTESNLLPLKSK
jgi:hypothetical protein